ncbi:MAG: EAL domain-containing protein [Methylobacterium mesophilicum]|nr:EAL domain-containing protein [Methylobacterium mesophilicum]
MLRQMLSFAGSDDVVIAQVQAFKRRVPILYAALGVNTLAIAVTRVGQIPPLLSIWVPALILLAIAFRLVHWHRFRHVVLDATGARGAIRRTTMVALVLAVAMLAWSLALYPYEVTRSVQGRITGHGQVVLYIALNVICCISLLMHVRLSALVVTTVVIPPFCAFLVWNGTTVEWAVAVNLMVVAGGLLYVMLVFSTDFEALVASKAELHAINAQQSQLANTDSLTGLANRRRFFGDLERACARSKPFAVMIVDLDGFKQINDLHGHGVGDAVLAAIGERIASHLPHALCVARMGGDEFAILAAEPPPLSTIQDQGQDVIAACIAPVVVAGNLVVSVGASVGIHVVTDGGVATLPEKHLERADFALAFAKQGGRGRVEVFTPAHEERLRRIAAIEQAMRTATFENELTVLYQPIVDTQTRAIRGFEALVRWNSPELGRVSPAEFIPLAERSDLVHLVTREVMRKALADLALWPAHIRLKINLSARDLGSAQQMLHILSLIERSAVDPRRLTFEITETALGGSLDLLKASIRLIKAAGASLAIDDFGTGYSSLSYIHTLNPDLIKIDRSFTSRIGTGDGAESIIKTVIELCRNIGARSLAEGTESREQVEILASLGCDELQGYYFGKPAANQAVLSMLQGRFVG